MTTNGKPLIRLSHVGKTFSMRGGDVHALKSVDVDIRSGDFLSIVGTSGSGKSTLLYILGMLIEPSRGTYHFHDHDVAKMDDQQRSQLRGREIGFVFQSFHLVPQLDVVGNVMLASRYVPGLDKRKHASGPANSSIVSALDTAAAIALSSCPTGKCNVWRSLERC